MEKSYVSYKKPRIKNKPSISPSPLPEVDHYPDPIHQYSKEKIVFDLESYECPRLNIRNRKLQSTQKKAFYKKVDRLEEMTWGESYNGTDSWKYRWVTASSLQCNQPPAVKEKGIPHFVCFKYNGKEHVFGGFFKDGIHFVVWIGQQSNDIYVH